MIKEIDSIIFDLDGTLWDSTEGIVETWNLILKDYPEIDRVITADDLAANFGLVLDVIARRLFPELPPELSSKLMDECGLRENEYLAEHGGLLYPQTEETLTYLGERYPLFIVSNCQEGYIESFYSGNKTGHFFKDSECIGHTGLSKGENIRLIMERNHLKAPVYVGDTQGDADAARAAGIPFIYAQYGFGSVTEYDAVIDSLSSLQALWD